jgi:hypothetical protein
MHGLYAPRGAEVYVGLKQVLLFATFK